MGARVMIMALNAVKGNVENKETLLAALRKVKFDAPRGPFAFDRNQNVILTTYIGEVRKVDGRYATVVSDSIPNVDQHWSPADMTAKK